MARPRHVVPVLLLLLLSTHAPARADRPWHVGFGGGASVPAGDLKDAFQNGYHGQAFVQFGALETPFGARIALNYQHFDLKSLAASPQAPSSGTGSVMSGLLNLSYGIRLAMIRPYVTAGLGAFQLGASPSGGSSSSKVHFGIDGGAGVQARVAAIHLFVEGRYENLFTDKGLDPNAASSKSFAAQVIPITFGVML